MNLQLYTQLPFTYNDVDFIIKAFHDPDNFSYKVKAFFINGKKANNFSYSVDYETADNLLAYTGDHAVEHLLDLAKEDIKNGFIFK